MYRILVAEEDEDVRNTLVNILIQHDYKTIGVATGEQVLQMVEREHISLLLCDVMLAETDGYELMNTLKDKNYNIPTLMFMSHNAKKHEKLMFLEKARGLLDYRDDEAILSRLQQMLQEQNPLEIEKISFGDVSVELVDMYAQIEDNRYPLVREEFLLLGKFIFFPNKIYTRMQLMQEIIDESGIVNEELFDQYMRRVQEIVSHSKEVEIKHIHGLGYKAIKKEGI